MSKGSGIAPGPAIPGATNPTTPGAAYVAPTEEEQVQDYWHMLSDFEQLTLFNSLPGNFNERLAALQGTIPGGAFKKNIAGMMNDVGGYNSGKYEIYDPALKEQMDKAIGDRNWLQDQMKEEPKGNWLEEIGDVASDLGTQMWNPGDSPAAKLWLDEKGQGALTGLFRGAIMTAATMGLSQGVSALGGKLSGASQAAAQASTGTAGTPAPTISATQGLSATQPEMIAATGVLDMSQAIAPAAAGLTTTIADVAGLQPGEALTAADIAPTVTGLGNEVANSAPKDIIPDVAQTGLSTADKLNLLLTGGGLVADYFTGEQLSDASAASTAAQLAANIRAQDIQQEQFQKQIDILEESKKTATGAIKEGIQNQIDTLTAGMQAARQYTTEGFGKATEAVESGSQEINRLLDASGERAGQLATDLAGANQFRAEEALGLGDQTRALGAQGLDAFSRAALNDDVLRRKLDIDEERTNQSLAARGLLNSSYGLGQIQEGRQSIVDDEMERQINRQLQLAQLGQGQVAAGQNILTQGGRDVSGLAERTADKTFGADTDVNTQRVQAQQDVMKNLANLAQTQGLNLSNISQNQAQLVGGAQGDQGRLIAGVETGVAQNASQASQLFGQNAANLATSAGRIQGQGTVDQAQAGVNTITNMFDTVDAGLGRYTTANTPATTTQPTGRGKSDVPADTPAVSQYTPTVVDTAVGPRGTGLDLSPDSIDMQFWNSGLTMDEFTQQNPQFFTTPQQQGLAGNPLIGEGYLPGAPAQPIQHVQPEFNKLVAPRNTKFIGPNGQQMAVMRG